MIFFLRPTKLRTIFHFQIMSDILPSSRFQGNGKEAGNHRIIKKLNKKRNKRKSQKSTLFAGTSAATSNSKKDRNKKKHKSTDSMGNEKKVKHALSKTDYSATTGSIEAGKNAFGNLIKPVPVTVFFEKHWEQKPLLVNRLNPNFYKHLISTEEIDNMLRDNHVEFTKNIDITQYKDGVRETLNPVGRALPPTVWYHYGEGCSIRILNPQTFLPTIHTLNATLQEYFQCMVGANVYLTPKNSQGFAPHYDDIEAFVLQIEGKKHWRIYEPSSRSHMLPRESSKNFTQDEIGKPCLDIVLEAGDLLYFPRGYIHQANTVKDSHSLHITLSVYQKHTFGDLMEILIPMAVKEAINENVSLRRGVPLEIWQQLGFTNSDNFQPKREEIITQLNECFQKVCSEVMDKFNIDNAVDQMAIKFQHDALPPQLTSEEKLRTVYNTKPKLIETGVPEYPFIEEDTKIRLIRANVARMVRHGDEIRVYYSSENSKEYHEFEENFLEIELANAPAVEVLIKSYPKFVTPHQLQLADMERSLAVAQDLWERGILMTEEPLV